MADTWAKIQRLDWIDEMLNIYGFINRDHIRRKFWVSTPQASIDLREYLRSNRGQNVKYNKTAKQYERAKG